MLKKKQLVFFYISSLKIYKSLCCARFYYWICFTKIYRGSLNIAWNTACRIYIDAIQFYPLGICINANLKKIFLEPNIYHFLQQLHSQYWRHYIEGDFNKYKEVRTVLGLSFRLSICPSFRRPVIPSVYPSAFPSVYLSVLPSIFPSVVPSVLQSETNIFVDISLLRTYWWQTCDITPTVIQQVKSKRNVLLAMHNLSELKSLADLKIRFSLKFLLIRYYIFSNTHAQCARPVGNRAALTADSWQSLLADEQNNVRLMSFVSVGPLQRWRSGLECSPRKRRVGCSNASRERPKS